MKCPFCGYDDTKVIDSRPLNGASLIRRRRECPECLKRFSTHERIEDMPLMVIKTNDRKEPFDRDKLREGILRACQKRPIPIDTIEKLVSEINESKVELTSRPARANKGATCGYCDVRQFCDSYWQQDAAKVSSNDITGKFIDIEILVDGQPTPYGFTGKTCSGHEVSVVCQKNMTKQLCNIQEGQKLRLLSALSRGDEIMMNVRTEIYHTNGFPLDILCKS